MDRERRVGAAAIGSATLVLAVFVSVFGVADAFLVFAAEGVGVLLLSLFVAWRVADRVLPTEG